MRGSSRKCAAITALVFAGVVAVGCSKKNEYGADTSAAMTQTDSTAYTASSTVPAAQDTTTASTSKSTGTKSTGTKSTTKKTTKKTTY